MKSAFIKIALIVLTLVCTNPGQAKAALITMDLTYSGVSYGNTAVATGSITFDDLFLVNPGNNGTALPSPLVTALTLNVSGATAGNGTFTLIDFNQMYFNWTLPLNFNQDLVGQATTGNTWGTPDASSGDFNLFSVTGAPTGTSHFELTVFGGDRMLLTSMSPDGAPVPEPGTLLLLGAGMSGLVYLRRRKTQEA